MKFRFDFILVYRIVCVNKKPYFCMSLNNEASEESLFSYITNMYFLYAGCTGGKRENFYGGD